MRWNFDPLGWGAETLFRAEDRVRYMDNILEERRLTAEEKEERGQLLYARSEYLRIQKERKNRAETVLRDARAAISGIEAFFQKNKVAG